MAAQTGVKPIPDGFHSLTPYLIIRGAAAAMDFYAKAFGATELYRMDGPDGTVAHAEMKVGDSPFMLSEENEQWGSRSPLTLGDSTVAMMLYVEDVDAMMQQAADAGAKVLLPAQDQFWGDRMGKIEDPYGHKWMLATHVEDVSPDEVARRAKEAFAQMS